MNTYAYVHAQHWRGNTYLCVYIENFYYHLYLYISIWPTIAATAAIVAVERRKSSISWTLHHTGIISVCEFFSFFFLHFIPFQNIFTGIVLAIVIIISTVTVANTTWTSATFVVVLLLPPLSLYYGIMYAKAYITIVRTYVSWRTWFNRKLKVVKWIDEQRCSAIKVQASTSVKLPKSYSIQYRWKWQRKWSK